MFEHCGRRTPNHGYTKSSPMSKYINKYINFNKYKPFVKPEDIFGQNRLRFLVFYAQKNGLYLIENRREIQTSTLPGSTTWDKVKD